MLLVAHRSSSGAAGVHRLSEAGANLFELDVQLRDGRLVVSHFLPVTASGSRVERDNWRLRRRGSGRHDPTLDEAVAALPGSAQVLLDPKAGAPAEQQALTSAFIDQLTEPDRYRISTASVVSLTMLRSAGLRTWRTIADRRQLADVISGGPLPDQAVSVRQSLLSPRSVDELHAVVPAVVAWTVNDVERARLLRALGVDGVTTDSLAVLRALS